MPSAVPPAGNRSRAATGTADLGAVAQQMTKHQVAGLPRNYELFHEALSGRNPELARDLGSLPLPPSQAQLDDIGFRHRLTSHCGLAASRSQADAAHLLRSLSEQLHAGLTNKRTFIRALELVGQSLRDDMSGSVAESLTAIDYLSSAVAELLKGETGLDARLKDGAKALDRIELGLGAMETVVLRDKLTGLPNRIAFATRISDLYDADVPPQRTALISAQIDHFALITERFGQPAANRLLKKLASIFRKSIKKNDFVARIGPDEFVFLFSNVGPGDAAAIAERLRSSVEDNLIFATADANDPDGLTISAGIAISDNAETAALLQTHAGTALGLARNNSRTPVMIHNPDGKGASIRSV